MATRMKMKTYTVFCREKTREGTTWIDNVQATTPQVAQKRAVKDCAADWSYPPRYVECYCVIEGDVKVVLFED